MSTTHAPWFETDPLRLQRELDALDALSVKPTVDLDIQRRGILRLTFTVDPALHPGFGLATEHHPVEVAVIYPDNFPYFKPEVYGLNVSLPRHQNPIQKNLCLLPRATEYWNVEWTVADYLVAQLDKVLTQGALVDESVLAADPDEQAEPASVYYANASNPIVFDSSGFDALVTAEAEITVLGRVQVGVIGGRMINNRMAVLEGTTAGNEEVVGRLPDALQKQFSLRFKGYVLRLSERPPYGNAAQDIQWLKHLAEKSTNGLGLRSRPLSKNGTTINQVWALNFPEEVGPGKMGMGWLFLIDAVREVTLPRNSGKAAKGALDASYYAQAARSNPRDIGVRVPSLTGLPGCSIAVVGLGAIGAPAVMEFARNQVGALRLMDFDSVNPATTVRWPLGVNAFGRLKTEVLEQFIRDEYPRTTVRVFEHKVGGSPTPDKPSERQIMDKLLTGVSLLFDASAEVGVSNFLSAEAMRRNIPYVSAYATPGAWGGLVMRVVPGKTKGCWMCLQYAKFNGTIPHTVSDVAAGRVQAPGCGDLTFTGASFDLQNVTLAAVRLAVSTLCADIPGGYPDASWDVGVLRLTDDEKLAALPVWQAFSLQAQCPRCLKN